MKLLIREVALLRTMGIAQKHGGQDTQEGKSLQLALRQAFIQNLKCAT